MPEIMRPRVVIDINVLFEGLTQQGSASGLVIDAWREGLLHVFISDALAYEYLDVLSRKLSEHRWQIIRPALIDLLAKAEFTSLFFTWRPNSFDPGDDFIVDCAMNANAVVITKNTTDFRLAANNLGLRVMRPAQLIDWLAQ